MSRTANGTPAKPIADPCEGDEARDVDVAIDALPTALDAFAATEAAYPDELAACRDALVRGLPVRVECDKQLVPFFYRCLRDRLKVDGLATRYLDGRPRPDDPPGLGLMGRMIHHLAEAVRGAVDERVLVLPHLDLLMGSGGGGGLSSEAREVVALLYENPTLVWLGFKDLSLQLPQVIESLFPRKVSILGVPRTRVARLVTQSEGRKFGRTLPVFQMYRYVSGVNAVQLRRVLHAIDGEDFPIDPTPAWDQLRNSTLTSDVTIPDLDLHRDIGGYKQVKDRLQKDIVDLVQGHQRAATAAEASRIEGLVPRGIIFWGPPGTGKCLGRGTPVMKYDGSVVPVEQICAGDLLMGPDSTPRRVLSTNVGHGQLFRVTPNKGDAWVCNDVHVMTLADTDTGQVYDMDLDRFLERPATWRARQKLFRVPVDFAPAEELPLDPYFLGVWFGDGSKTIGDHGLLGVQVSKPDAEIEQLCRDTASRFGLQVTATYGRTGCPTWKLVKAKGGQDSNPLLDLLRGIVGPEIQIPHQYLTASREDRAAFLAGVIDSDGCADGAGIEIVQKRQDWAEAIAFVARSLGLLVTIRPKTVEEYGVYHRITISGDFAEIPIRIPRKVPQARKGQKDVLRTGFQVDPIGEGDYYGFTLDGDGRFLLGDFTVTHNTLFAKAMARSLGAAVIVVSGPELKSKWVGESESNLRRVFIQARQSAPAVIVFDEMDSFAAARGTFEGSGVEHSMVNTLLTEMDGFRRNEMVFIVGTTNFVESLDPALLRPGRFEFKLQIPFPNDDDRRAILEIYNAKLGLGLTSEALDYAVRRTADPVEGSGQPYTGDHLQAACRALARQRLREGATGPSGTLEVEAALTAHVERPRLTPFEERVVAVHECGHAICALHCEHVPPISRITILGDLGGALGHVRLADPTNRQVVTRAELVDRLCVMFGGRAAELLVLGDLSVGAAGDIAHATQVAREMVEMLGMGVIAPASYRVGEISEPTRAEIDDAVRALVSEADARARALVEAHRHELEALCAMLLEHKVLDQHTLPAFAKSKASTKS